MAMTGNNVVGITQKRILCYLMNHVCWSSGQLELPKLIREDWIGGCLRRHIEDFNPPLGTCLFRVLIGLQITH